MMKMHHVGIEVKSLDKTENFYCSLFGFQVKSRLSLVDEEIAFLNNGDFTIELIEVSNWDAPTKSIHFALEVDSLSEWMKRLSAKLKPIEGPFQLENGWKVVFYEGINNEMIELIQVKKKRL